jgi:hypothetical protein
MFRTYREDADSQIFKVAKLICDGFLDRSATGTRLGAKTPPIFQIK